MRKVVLLNDLVTSDITYGYLYEEYKRLLEIDITTHFMESSSLVDVACPGCGKKANQDIYKKMKMNFKLCSKCGTYYVSPRPDPQSLEKFYRLSNACIFWRKESLNLPESKLNNLFSPRINWILELSDEFLHGTSLLMDFETKYPFFIKQVHKQKIFNSVITFKPKVYEQSALLPDGMLTEYNIENYYGRTNVITAFESLERMFDPGELFSIANKCCPPGGLLLITTASGSGFEYQVLGEKAPNINPINRMNLLSLEVLSERVESAGFEIIELSTPGRLDVESVRNVVKESDDVQIHPFWKYLFKYRTEETWQSLQDFLQVNRLSSHIRIAALKK
ncbi:MAG: class I SAM-dependent methyltransferase [Candidatus Brocadiaceae bacterium]|nr:class I SAM-dependent methyltransferase [Candidatus Brocadiaceae bacterium]